MTSPTVLTAATCLGCGCTCDDIDLTVSDAKIVAAERACELGVQWFGDGSTTSRALVSGAEVEVDVALDHAASVLLLAARRRVLLAADVSCETYREAIACADLLRARVDLVSRASATTAIAIQEHGIATATLGEIRNRGDVIVFWGVNPMERFPRFLSRYAPQPVGTHVTGGRASRTVIAVDVDSATGPADVDVRVSMTQAAELDTLIALTASMDSGSDRAPSTWKVAAELAGLFRRGKYIVIIADASAAANKTSPRLHRLLELSRALNRSGRGALTMLRDGGNLCGAESVLTRQSGYPGGIEFASGVPRYRPHSSPPNDATLWVGSARRPTDDVLATIDAAATVAIGPALSDSAFRSAAVVIDSGTAGIHSAGSALRMDDVPVPLKQAVAGPPDAAELCRGLRLRLRTALGRA